MRSLVGIVSIIVFAGLFGVPSLARAHHDNDRDDRGAPEPLTVIGLGLGAAGIGVARWVYRRRSARKEG
jgi:hypothetical protein